MSLNVETLEQSFEKIKPRANEFAARFYENLFKAHPEMKPVFTSTDANLKSMSTRSSGQPGLS